MPAEAAFASSTVAHTTRITCRNEIALPVVIIIPRIIANTSSAPVQNKTCPPLDAMPVTAIRSNDTLTRGASGT